MALEHATEGDRVVLFADDMTHARNHTICPDRVGRLVLASEVRAT